MNPIQKYPHITELSGCILNKFVFVLFCPINLFQNFLKDVVELELFLIEEP